MFKTKRVKELEEELHYVRTVSKDRAKQIEHDAAEIASLKKIIREKDIEIADLSKMAKDNDIMRKYYKLDEEPSAEVQALVRADLRIEEIMYQSIKEKLDELHYQLNSMENQRIIAPFCVR